MAVIEEKKEAKKVTKKSAPKKAEKVVAIENAETACRVLVEPWITEKSHAAIANGKYTFRVEGHANKKEVRTAIESLYKVKVEKISIVNAKPKRRSYGRYFGFKTKLRKATVTLKKGDKIELFQGA